ncbi:diguanylate cyclase/phosphodiesterase with PAS/PAC sensor(s) [Sulfurimonas denitrificans DSM 1251]|uniref:Diguanylate cyclase/phosphodiesterase with PAS/PAC sensor(S) n=1 Tax=Sulfurimonas denitrificans (strain ATCC 33889 / DSM 1251) TaxID=326298 RepID=Q30RY6_SULDN|nr:bacteriohemerythrin [Sulfurimonas denitrificans]ABB44245.1 diguanylate cyclase/phosphodiesterase with PAS/PAC sensor(s) [Sulfurimonas denitrificans DSM 1251]MDD3443499.1 bacteriohemerythrin [Sulfurimonas denitrificans]
MKTIDIFPWSNHFNTEIKIIDEQHKKLVIILNRLATHIAYSDTDDDLNDIFDELIDYTSYHFETEEAIWHKYLPNDELDASHKVVHKTFVDTVLRLKNEQNRESLSELAQEALGFLASWLASHILETDRHMAYIVFAIEDGLDIASAKKYANERMSGSTRLLIDIILSIYSTLSSNTLDLMRELKMRENLKEKLIYQEHYQRALIDNFPFLVWLKDEKSRFLALNQPMAKACGFDLPEEVVGKTDYDIWPKELAKSYRKDDANVLASGESKTVEEPIVTKDGVIWSETYKSPVKVDGKVIGTVGFSRNITSRKELEKNLLQERDLFKHYLNTVEAIIVSLDKEGHINLINRKGCEILGYSEEELIGKLWFDFCLEQPEGMKIIYPLFLKIVSGGLEGSEYFENKIVSKSKKKYLIAWHNAYLLDDDKNIIGTLSSGEDITLLKEQQKHLEHIAHYDTLTSLPNRTLLSDRLKQAMLQTQRDKLFSAVIYLDLDGFKEVNDTYGHNHGDILLKVLSSRIKQILRDVDTIARLGGDEFVIVLYDIKNKEDCFPMLNRILSTIAKPVKSKEITMQVSASAGVSFYSYEDIIDADQLLRQADQAMYQAKLSGKNRFHIFDVQLDKHIRSHHESLEAIEVAIKNREFVMYYQPKVNMRSGKILGLEALVRWEHPLHGLLSPAHFLPTIENHKLSVELGNLIINTVMGQIQKWKQEGHNLVVSINISPMQIQEANFTAKIINLLKNYPEVKTSDFEFEILESSALEDINHVSRIMRECNKIGISFLLDDFGTGYSSLTYLKNLPAKQLKIDQTFVRDMLEDTDDMAILEGIIGLANAFRRDVISEGVENIEQGNMLLRLGCEEAQGYFIAKPMPSQEVMKWINQWTPPAQWQNIVKIPRDDMPLLYAITEHKIWIKDVMAYLKTDTVKYPKLDYKECRFGTWLYTQGVQRYGKKDGFKEVVSQHKKVHENINEIIKQHKSQTLKNIDASIEEIKNYHNDFLKVFNKLIIV